MKGFSNRTLTLPLIVLWVWVWASSYFNVRHSCTVFCTSECLLIIQYISCNMVKVICSPLCSVWRWAPWVNNFANVPFYRIPGCLSTSRSNVWCILPPTLRILSVSIQGVSGCKELEKNIGGRNCFWPNLRIRVLSHDPIAAKRFIRITNDHQFCSQKEKAIKRLDVGYVVRGKDVGKVTVGEWVKFETMIQQESFVVFSQ